MRQGGSPQARGRRGLARCAYLAGLTTNFTVPLAGDGRAELIVTQVAVLDGRAGNLQPQHPSTVGAIANCLTLDTLVSDVRRHLRPAARGLTELQPPRYSAPSTAQPMR